MKDYKTPVTSAGVGRHNQIPGTIYRHKRKNHSKNRFNQVKYHSNHILKDTKQLWSKGIDFGKVRLGFSKRDIG